MGGIGLQNVTGLLGALGQDIHAGVKSQHLIDNNWDPKNAIMHTKLRVRSEHLQRALIQAKKDGDTDEIETLKQQLAQYNKEMNIIETNEGVPTTPIPAILLPAILPRKTEEELVNGEVLETDPKNTGDEVTPEELEELELTVEILDPADGEQKEITVKAGDTLSQIAKDNGLTLTELLALNPDITNPNKIRTGQKINVKGTTEPTNQRVGTITESTDNEVEVDNTPKKKGFFARIGESITNFFSKVKRFISGNDNSDIDLTVPGYPEDGKNSWRAENDEIILSEVDAYNTENGFEPGHDEYLDPRLVKAQMMQESGGHKKWFKKDPMQVNNLKVGANGKTDWVDKKGEFGLTKGELPGATLSVRAGIKWLKYKGSHTTVSTIKGVYTKTTKFKTWKEALRGYNGNSRPHSKYPNIQHRDWYADNIYKNYNKMRSK